MYLMKFTKHRQENLLFEHYGRHKAKLLIYLSGNDEYHE